VLVSFFSLSNDFFEPNYRRIYWTDFHVIFNQMVGICLSFIDPNLFFDSSRDAAMTTNCGKIGEMTLIQHSCISNLNVFATFCANLIKIGPLTPEIMP